MHMLLLLLLLWWLLQRLLRLMLLLLRTACAAGNGQRRQLWGSLLRLSLFVLMCLGRAHKWDETTGCCVVNNGIAYAIRCANV
jgi:hypothetical protein